MHRTVADFRDHVARRRSPRTAKTYAAISRVFIAFVAKSPSDLDSLSPEYIEAFLARSTKSGERRSPATHNQELAALRAFFQFGAQLHGWGADPTAGIPFAREAPRDPAVLGVGELRTVFEVAERVSAGRMRSRNHALLAILAQAGLRVHELVALDVSQVDIPSATLVSVHGKGGSTHDLPVNPGTLGLLKIWLADRLRLAPQGETALFVSATGRRISIRSVQRLVARVRVKMGTAKHITPHTFRHSCATLALTLGADLSTVSDLLRHTDLNTTRRYLHLVDERRREAVRKLEVALPPNLAPRATNTPPFVAFEQRATPPSQGACAAPSTGSSMSQSHAQCDSVRDVQKKVVPEPEIDLDAQQDFRGAQAA